MSSNKTWLPYSEITHLRALTDYFEILDIKEVSQLTDSNIGDASDDESNMAAGCILIYIC